jgi:hypothetical protein
MREEKVKLFISVPLLKLFSTTVMLLSFPLLLPFQVKVRERTSVLQGVPSHSLFKLFTMATPL